MSNPTVVGGRATGPSPPPSVPPSADDERDIAFLNTCLANAHQLHTLASISFTTGAAAPSPLGPRAAEAGHSPTSVLLQEDTQAYLRALRDRYGASIQLRRRLRSGVTLYYLQCLTDERTRADFVRAAAHPSFVLTDPS